jgi:MFS family permease
VLARPWENRPDERAHASPREADVCLLELRRRGAHAEPRPVPHLFLLRGERRSERLRRRRDPTCARLRGPVTLIGFLSDRTNSARPPGSLHPLATPFWALFSFLLFTPPESSAAAAGAYLFIVIELYFLSSTLSGGPYEALLPEIAPDSDERVSIVGMRVYLGAAGAGLGLVGGFLLVDAVGYAGMAATLAVVALGFRYLGLAGAWPFVSRTQEPAELGLREALSITFRNRYFLYFLPAFALQLGFQILLGSLPFLIEAALEIDEIGRWGAALTAVALGTMVVTIPVMTRLSHRMSKRSAYRVSLLAAVVLFHLLAFAGFLPGIPPEAQLVVAMVVVGLPIAGNYLFHAPLTADIIDYDALQTGLRREATYGRRTRRRRPPPSRRAVRCCPGQTPRIRSGSGSRGCRAARFAAWLIPPLRSSGRRAGRPGVCGERRQPRAPALLDAARSASATYAWSSLFSVRKGEASARADVPATGQSLAKP